MKMKMDDGREERRGESEREELLSTHGELSTFPSSRVQLWKLQHICEV
jgi:hypothetical protein